MLRRLQARRWRLVEGNRSDLLIHCWPLPISLRSVN
jgi:hypothetical protein